MRLVILMQGTFLPLEESSKRIAALEHKLADMPFVRAHRKQHGTEV